MVSEDWAQLAWRIRQSRTEGNASEVSNSSGLDHVGLLNPRFVDAGGFLACSSRCRTTCAFLLEDVGLLAGMSGVSSHVDP